MSLLRLNNLEMMETTDWITKGPKLKDDKGYQTLHVIEVFYISILCQCFYCSVLFLTCNFFFREYVVGVLLFFGTTVAGNLALGCNISMPIQMIFKSVSSSIAGLICLVSLSPCRQHKKINSVIKKPILASIYNF